MGKSVPQPPPQPDPRQVAAAQTGANVTQATGTAYLSNANQFGPYGSTQFAVDHTNDIADPATGQTYSVPTFNQTTTLAPAQQQMLDQQNQLGINLNDLALNQTQRIGNILGQPAPAPGTLATSIPGAGAIQKNVSMAMAPTSVNVSQAPTTFGQTAGNIQYDIGGDAWDKATGAILDRLNPQIAADRTAQENKLFNQGFTPTANMGANSDAYQTAVDQFNRQANDARTQAILSGFDVSKGIGEFNNAAQQQDYTQQEGRGTFAQQGTLLNNNANLAAGQFAQSGISLNNAANLSAGQFANAAQGQLYGQNAQDVTFQNQAMAQAYQQLLASRNQPINEISALMSGGQVSMPQFQGYQSQPIANTPIGDYYMQNAAMANANYQAQLQANTQQTAGLYGGLGSLAGAGLYGLGRRFG